MPFVISGIAVGAVYGLAATGLVLTYKTSGIFNLGHGALAAVAGYVFFWLRTELGMDWKLAFAISVFVVGPLMGLAMERLAARLATQPTALKIVGTVGTILIVQGAAALLFGTNTIRVPQFLPGAGDAFHVGGVAIGHDKAIIAAVALVAVTVLYAFFRWSRAGIAMRAVVDDPDLLAMRGTDPALVRRVSWVIGATFAALSGVLVVPLIGLDAISLTFMVVHAFAAAAIGAFTSIPLTLAGGFLVGVAASLGNWVAVDTDWLSGLPASVPFLVLLVVLIARGRGLVTPGRAEERPPSPYRAPIRLRLAASVIVLVPLLFVPTLAGDRLTFFTIGLATGILVLSLGLLVRTAGQVSLCHAALAAIGAVAFSQFQLELGLPWLLAVFLGALIVVPIGALVAIPAVRLSGVFLALATFGFGILVQQLLYPQSWMFTELAQGREMPRPDFAQDPETFYFLVLGFFALSAVAMILIERGRLGRLLNGLAESPTGLSAMGLSTAAIRVTVFGISAFFAGLAGILIGVERAFATGSDPLFDSFSSLVLLAMLALAPFAEPWYALVVAITAVIPGYVSGDGTTHWLNLLFGVFAVLVAARGGNPVMPPSLRDRLERLGRLGGRGRKPAVAGRAAPTPVTRHAAGRVAGRVAARGKADPGIEVHDLCIDYGGLAAVRSMSLSVQAGRIVGLIGPNGAGKTSTFDACSGFNRQVSGRIVLKGQDVTRLSPAARARRGLGRTFQSARLCDGLTVRENVRLGFEAARAGANPLRQLVSGRAAWATTREAAEDAIGRCGLADVADVPVGALSTGHRRSVELARCLAGSFDVLLLDEPCSGLDPAETAAFGDLLLELVAERPLAILLVEHDMALVSRICDYIHVMDFGRPIFAGTPAEVAASDVVRAAYLGSEADAAVPPSAAADPGVPGLQERTS